MYCNSALKVVLIQGLIMGSLAFVGGFVALSRLALLSSEFGLRVEAQGMQGQGLLWKSSLGSSLGASCGTLNPGFGDLVVKFHSWDFQSLEQDKQDFSRVGGGPGQKLQHDQDGLRFCQGCCLQGEPGSIHSHVRGSLCRNETEYLFRLCNLPPERALHKLMAFVAFVHCLSGMPGMARVLLPGIGCEVP